MIIKIKTSSGKVVDAGFKFNINYAFESLISMKGIINFTSLGTAMIFCAYKAWCYAKQIDEELTFEDILDWIDSGNNEDIIRMLTDEFQSSPVWKKVQESLKKNEATQADELEDQKQEEALLN